MDEMVVVAPIAGWSDRYTSDGGRGANRAHASALARENEDVKRLIPAGHWHKVCFHRSTWACSPIPLPALAFRRVPLLAVWNGLPQLLAHLVWSDPQWHTPQQVCSFGRGPSRSRVVYARSLVSRTSRVTCSWGCCALGFSKIAPSSSGSGKSNP